MTQKFDSPCLLIAETLTCDLQVETSLRCTHSKLSFSFPIVRSFSGMFRLDNLPIKKFKRCPSFFFRLKKGLQKLLTSKKKTCPFKICSFGKNFCCGDGGLVVDAVASGESDPRFSSGYFQLFSAAVMICLT